MCVMDTLGCSLSLALNRFCFSLGSLMSDAFGHLLLLCQHLLPPNSDLSLLKYAVFFFLKISWKSLVKNDALPVTFRISLSVPIL